VGVGKFVPFVALDAGDGFVWDGGVESVRETEKAVDEIVGY